jgi:hypothetical protein
MFVGVSLSYGYNQLLAAHAGTIGSLARVQRPAEVLLVADSAHKDAVPEQVVFPNEPWAFPPIYVAVRIVWANVCAAACDAPWLPEPGAARRVDKNTRHHLGSILGYADGHVKYIQHRILLDPARNRSYVGLDQLHTFILQ